MDFQWLTEIFIFKVYLVGFIGSFIAQTFLRLKFGRQSAWGLNRGWQNEIALWNVFAIFCMLGLITSQYESGLIICGLFAMSAGFAINHGTAFRKLKTKSNLVGFIANLIGVLLILFWALQQVI